MVLDHRPVEPLPSTAISIIEEQPVAAASREYVAADAERGPDLGRIAQLPSKRSNVVATIIAMKLDRVQLQHRRRFRNLRQRHIAKHADRTLPILRNGLGQRPGFNYAHMAGAAGSEDEAGKCRWPSSVQGHAAIQSANFHA